MQNSENNPRRDFLKNISIAAVSISAFLFLKFKKHKDNNDIKIKTLSKEEADEIIKNKKILFSKKMKPDPSPNLRNNTVG